MKNYNFFTIFNIQRINNKKINVNSIYPKVLNILREGRAYNIFWAKPVIYYEHSINVTDIVHNVLCDFIILTSTDLILNSLDISSGQLKSGVAILSSLPTNICPINNLFKDLINKSISYVFDIMEFYSSC